MTYEVIGNQGSFITKRKDAKTYYKKGDWTNDTGEIKRVIQIKRGYSPEYPIIMKFKKKPTKKKSPTNYWGLQLKLPKYKFTNL